MVHPTQTVPGRPIRSSATVSDSPVVTWLPPAKRDSMRVSESEGNEKYESWGAKRNLPVIPFEHNHPAAGASPAMLLTSRGTLTILFPGESLDTRKGS